MKSDDLRELRRATKAVKQIARDVREMFEPSPRDTVRYMPDERYSPTRPKHPELSEFGIPQDYSYVRCESCSAPAILVRDNTNDCFAACCLNCSTISHLETIIEERPDGPGKKT